MKTKSAMSVSAIFILLLAVPGLAQPKRIMSGDENERPHKMAKIEEPTDVTMSSDDEPPSDWAWEIEEKITEMRETNPHFSDATAILFVGAQEHERTAVGLVKSAIAEGADVNAIDSAGMTALMYFAEIGATDIITILLENHANMNIVDPQGNSLLIVAMNAEFAQVSTAQFLINCGMKIGDKEIQVAFDVAEKYRTGRGLDAEDMLNEWTEFANSLLEERMTQFTTQMATFSQVNLPQNVEVELPSDILFNIGSLLWRVTSHL